MPTASPTNGRPTRPERMGRLPYTPRHTRVLLGSGAGWALDAMDVGLISFVGLAAGLDTRLERNRTEHRLAEKRSKRDLDWSDSNVRDMERHVMNTDDRTNEGDLPGLRLLGQHRHLRLDNSQLTPEQSAVRILDWLTGSDQ